MRHVDGWMDRQLGRVGIFSFGEKGEDGSSGGTANIKTAGATEVTEEGTEKMLPMLICNSREKLPN